MEEANGLAVASSTLHFLPSLASPARSCVRDANPYSVTRGSFPGEGGTRMKLNFWQWLGVVLLLIAIGFWINRQMTERAASDAGKPAPGFDPSQFPEEEPTTEPSATAPSTAPAP